MLQFIKTGVLTYEQLQISEVRILNNYKLCRPMCIYIIIGLLLCLLHVNSCMAFICSWKQQTQLLGLLLLIGLYTNSDGSSYLWIRTLTITRGAQEVHDVTA